MLILLHVLTALTSIAYTTYLYFQPSKRKLYIGYGFIAATLASGTYLIVSTHAPILQACTTGLTYLGVVTVGVVAARRKLTSN